MELIFNILGWASLAAIWVDFIDTLDTEQKLPQKPFKCALCSGFWLSVLPMIYVHNLEGILYAAIAGVTSEIIDRYLNK